MGQHRGGKRRRLRRDVPAESIAEHVLQRHGRLLWKFLQGAVATTIPAAPWSRL